MTQGETIKQARLKRGMTQEELAKLLRVKRETVYKYEKDIIKNIPLGTKKLLCDILNIRFWHLLNNQELATLTKIPIQRLEEIDRIKDLMLYNATIANHEGEYPPIVETDKHLCLNKDWFKNTIDSIKDYIVYSMGKEKEYIIQEEVQSNQVKSLNLKEKIRNKNKE